MKEVWREVLDGYYEVSNLGRIRRAKPGKGGTYVGRILRGYVASEGKDGQWNYLLHCLVAEAFLGPKQDGKEVNHKDGIKLHCGVDNLEYLTTKKNHEHASRLGLKAHGSRHGRTILTEKKVMVMRKLFNTGRWTKAALARKFGVGEFAVYGIVLRRTWKHVL